MNNSFEIIKTTRQNFLKSIDNLSIDQLNKIPTNFNNNIAWNFGHVVVTLQGLSYGLSGLERTIGQFYIDKYKKGTKPTSFISSEEIDFLKKQGIASIEQLQKDCAADVFKNFKPYSTSFGLEIDSLKTALAFIPVHEALHWGTSMAIKKLV